MIKKVRMTCNMLSEQSVTSIGSIKDIKYTECGYKTNDIPPDENWLPYTSGTRISGSDKHYWFKLKFTTPVANEHQTVILKATTGFEGERDTINPQSMVFVNGVLRQAFDTNHTELRLEPLTDYEIYIYFYVGSVSSSFEFKIGLAMINEPVRQLFYDISVPLHACDDVYYENSFEYSNTLKVLEQACNMLDLNYPHTEEYYEKLELAREFLKKEYYEKLCGNSNVTVNCIGHTHIDVAWLWTLAQTREKVQRSFATVLELMKYYPEYKFMMSQPQLFKYLSEVDPLMYSKVKQLVKEGRFELEGAMWLEADCNLTSGESLVRQILHGKRFLKQEFGIDSKVLWLPDVFGYSAALPQILNKSGINHFVTSKISWNDTNVLPYDTFIWQGIDGSEIITDFITTQNFKRGGEIENETTYVGEINPSMVAGCWNRYQQKAYNDEVMLVYGWGDGGGGPTADMLEQQRRLSYGLPSIPKTRMSTLAEHLKTVEANFEKNCREIGRIPKWVGELYLEFHRGTYTSMAKNKRYNRKSEMLLQKLESLAAINSVIKGEECYKEDLYSMWDTVLLNQFHDIIPGSSIREVYEDSHRQYEEIIDKGTVINNNLLSNIAENINSNGGVLVYNPLGFERSDIIALDGKVYETGNISAYGWKVITPKAEQSRVKVEENIAENDFYILELDSSGRISRLYDKQSQREVFINGQFANEFQVFEDMPLLYENWEISNYYKDKCKVLNDKADISVIDEGCRKGFKIERKYHNSVITQYIYLYDTVERVDVKNVIDWHEHRQLVKIAFPIDIHTNKATYDIQFGNVERTTNSNTSWDAAKFEVCGQKWVDMSEYNFGVSLLNDCKYGYSTEENVLKLTAIKCGTYPNEVADQGLHEFTYSIFSHKGDFRTGGTVKEAYSLNQPLEAVEIKNNSNGNLPNEFSFVKTDCDNIIIDTVKQCEDDGSVIIRLFDAYNCKSKLTLTFGIPVKKAEICDLMENPIEEIPVDSNSLSVDCGNFEIITIKIKYK